MTSLTQTIHELAGKGWQGLTLTATPLFGALAIERQLVSHNQSPTPVVESPPQPTHPL